jgi:hypothetical protein
VGNHAVYGFVTVADWRAETAAGAGDGNGPPVRVGIGLLLAERAAMPRDLKAKFALFEDATLGADYLVVLWPRPAADDFVATLPEATRQVWNRAPQRRRAALRPVGDDDLRKMLAFPEWLDSVQTLSGQVVPEELLRSFVRQHCESLVQKALPHASDQGAGDAN